MPYPGEEIIHIQKFTTSLTHRGDMKVVGVGEGLCMVANGCNGFRSCWLELYRGMYRVVGEELSSV